MSALEDFATSGASLTRRKWLPFIPPLTGEDALFWIEWIDKLIAHVIQRAISRRRSSARRSSAFGGGQEVYRQLLNSVQL